MNIENIQRQSSKLSKFLVSLLILFTIVIVQNPVVVKAQTIIGTTAYWSGSGNPNTKSYSISIPTGYTNIVVHVSNGSGVPVISPGTGNYSVSPGSTFSLSVGGIGGPASASVYVTGDIPHSHSYTITRTKPKSVKPAFF